MVSIHGSGVYNHHSRLMLRCSTGRRGPSGTAWGTLARRAREGARQQRRIFEGMARVSNGMFVPPARQPSSALGERSAAPDYGFPKRSSALPGRHPRGAGRTHNADFAPFGARSFVAIPRSLAEADEGRPVGPTR